MKEMERRMRKQDAIRFLDNWRRYVRAGKCEEAEGFFLGGWSTSDDAWSVEVLNQMTREDFQIIIEYPIWM